jgi:hypothetical protein
MLPHDSKETGAIVPVTFPEPGSKARLTAFYAELNTWFSALDFTSQCILFMRGAKLFEAGGYLYMRTKDMKGVILRQVMPEPDQKTPEGMTRTEWLKVEIVETLPSLTKGLAKAEVNDGCPFEPCAWETRTFVPTNDISFTKGFRSMAQPFDDLKYKHRDTHSKFFGKLN